MITVNALGEACPMPVVKAKKAIDALTAPETVQVLVDNDAAVQNLIRLAGQYGFAVRAEKQGEAQFSVTIDAAGAKKDVARKTSSSPFPKTTWARVRKRSARRCSRPSFSR